MIILNVINKSVVATVYGNALGYLIEYRVIENLVKATSIDSKNFLHTLSSSRNLPSSRDLPQKVFSVKSPEVQIKVCRPSTRALLILEMSNQLASISKFDFFRRAFFKIELEERNGNIVSITGNYEQFQVCS